VKKLNDSDKKNKFTEERDLRKDGNDIQII